MMALKTYMRIAAEERAWAYHLSMDRAEADYWNGIRLAKRAAREEGWKDGREEGWKDGERNRALSDARNMLTRNYPVTDIAEITGLPLAEVEDLAQNLR